MDLAINAALACDPETDLLGQFTVNDVDMKPLHVRKMIFLAAPFVSLFLERDLMPTEVWNRLHIAIVDVRQEGDYQPIMDYIRVALTKKVGDNESPLALLGPTVLLTDEYIIHH